MVSLSTLIDLSVPPLTFTLLAAVGLDLTPDQFARVRRAPRLVFAGVAGPPLLLPPIAAGLAWLFRPPPDTAAALLLIAICPIGGISNTYSYLARASPALSVTLTGLSCLLAAITMPLLGRAFGAVFPQHVIPAPPVGAFLVELLLMLTLPVGLGMWVRRRWPDRAERAQPAIQRLAFAGVGLVLALIVLDDPHAFVDGLSTTVPLAAIFVACSSAAGWLLAAAVSDDARDRFTVAVEFGTRNLGVAMAVAVTLLGRVEFARFAYAYFLTEMPLMLLAITWFLRRQAARAQHRVTVV